MSSHLFHGVPKVEPKSFCDDEAKLVERMLPRSGGGVKMTLETLGFAPFPIHGCVGDDARGAWM